MKINKKLKNSLISSLILISSAISVVGCGREKNEEDQNYKYFLSKMNNIDLNYKNQFIENTYLRDFFYTSAIFNSHFNFSVSDFNLVNTKLFGIIKEKKVNRITPTNLTDLKNQKIKIDKDNKNILFKLDYGTFDLKNIIFISNFNLKISKNDNESMVFNNITVFFQLSPNFSLSKKSDYNLDLYDCSGISGSINFGISDDQYKKMTFTFDNKDDMHKPDIGYNSEFSKNSISTGSIIDGTKYNVNWRDPKIENIEIPLLFNMDLNKQIILDGTTQLLSIECNKIVTQIKIEGEATDIKDKKITKNLYSSFFSEFDAKNPEPASFKKGNFIIVFKHD